MRGCWGAVPTTRPDPSFRSYEFAWFFFNHEVPSNNCTIYGSGSRRQLNLAFISNLTSIIPQIINLILSSGKHTAS